MAVVRITAIVSELASKNAGMIAEELALTNKATSVELALNVVAKIAARMVNKPQNDEIERWVIEEAQRLNALGRKRK